MKADGLIPIAFADSEGWPAMGTFDILNLRQNGYDFHVGLMAGKEKWTDPKVTAVFQKWTELLPFHPKAAPAGSGRRRRRRWSRRRPACTSSGLFVSAQFGDRTRPTSRTSTSSRTRRSGTDTTRRRRSTLRSTGS